MQYSVPTFLMIVLTLSFNFWKLVYASNPNHWYLINLHKIAILFNSGEYPFMEWMGKLYDFERDYRNADLPPDEIKKRRSGSETTEIVGSIWMELTRLLADPLPKSDLISKALNYLKNA